MNPLASRVRSFGNAFRGLAFLVQREPNARIHAAAALAVCALAFLLDLGGTQWALLVLAIAAVFSAEALNTAIEILADRVSADPDPAIGRAKDLAAAGVLAVAIGAALVGLWVLGPPLWRAVAA